MADEILTPEQVGDLRRQYLGTRPLLDSHEALRAERDEWRERAMRRMEEAEQAEADRDRLAAEVAQLTADLESHDVETQRRIATLTREFNESYTRLAAENANRLLSIARDIENGDC